MVLSRCQLLSVNGPAPTGSLLKPLAPLALNAVGDTTNGIVAAACGNRAFLALSVILSVSGSTTSIEPIRLAWAALMPLLAGSWMRAQLNFTAAASYAVPSVNLMLGLSLSVHTSASDDVSDSAVWALIWPAWL